MNKSDLIDAIHKKTGVKKGDVETVVKAFVETTMTTVSKGDKVSLVGFGNFSTITRKARQGRNPATGRPIKIPQKTVPKFTAGKVFLDKVR